MLIQTENSCENERRELIEIFNTLKPKIRQQLLTTARIIQTTQDIILEDNNKKFQQMVEILNRN